MTKIEWTERTWNPIVGCSVVSPGCTSCYAMKMAARIERMGGAPQYDGTTKDSRAGAVWTGKVALAEKALLAPLKRNTPTTYFVNSMGDLFHEDVPDEWIDQVFAIMALCPQHTFQVLTKRSARMREYVDTKPPDGQHLKPAHIFSAGARAGFWKSTAPFHWPLPNVWLGVSAEDQQRADERIPDLLATPAAVRFISAEPLLRRIDLLQPQFGEVFCNAKCNEHCQARGDEECPKFFGKIDWVIVGGESGKNARPMHPDWARSLRDQCAAAGVSFFFKQWGEFVSVSEVEGEGSHFKFPDGATVRRIGKKAAGRTLDGHTHSETPNIRTLKES
ncbi:phage Gp37/Gp68 family protein [uncultured Sulfitobacter sp.]|uniref:phage Gp37/Gp68 family protein n=1 Tax=uncultured Sulfitobacter sp. TaxID=191468 RepID=UPI0026232EB0|nr:phage Gp37/Gp68 family protein [uncultured Sulfitobacter sp.]